MLREARRLYALGFAIHWLRPRSKAPVESKWTSGPRKTINELDINYRPGMNIGVRLGKASKLDTGRTDPSGGKYFNYLAVVDCDVKSADPKHAAEMRLKLKELFPLVEGASPRVSSGRGNGSAHYYIRTKDPASPKRLAQSSEKVKVKMPSVAPSKKDNELLKPEEIKAGMRIRAAWEISLMGEGQQVVLPPSIHPDSGKPYAWAKPITTAGDIPLCTIEAEKEAQTYSGGGDRPATSSLGSEPAVLKGFKPVEVDLYSGDLSDRVINMIEDGENVEDRSAALFGASMALVRSGFSDNEILSVLTDRRNFLGKAAFDHAKTNDRTRAARWILRYTLRKARDEADAAKQFEGEVEVSSLSENEIEAQHAELLAIADWRTHIERSSDKNGARPKCTFGNILLILENAPPPQVFRYNEFSAQVIYGAVGPWGGKVGAAIRDIDLINIKSYLSNYYRIEPSQNLIGEVAAHIAFKNKFHPVRDYLGALKWDGVERIDTWLKDHLGASAPEPYLSAVSRKVLVAMIARAYEPGVKFDQVLILEGFQGKGKSTALRHLAGDKWFTDAHINIKDKDAVLALQAHWIVELGELSGMRKADVDSLKEFISRQTDKIRVPFGKLPEDFPRQCIFIGTTNRDEFLKDETGNRRYWPVSVSRYDFKSLIAVRDQLFAEARVAWELCEPLYLEDERAARIAVAEQEQRLESDVLIEQLETFFDNQKGRAEEDRFNVEKFTMGEIFADGGPLAGQRDGRPEQLRAAQALRRLGYEKCVRRDESGSSTKVWIKKISLKVAK